MSVGSRTHPGKVRPTNEDAYIVCRIGRYLERMASNLPETFLEPRFEDSGYVLLLADGMGGVSGGEVASHLALASTIQRILDAPKWALKLDDPATRETEIREMWERVRGYLAGAHETLRGQAAAHPDLAGMGTTLTGAYTVGRDLFVLHVGDSRAYLFRDGRVEKITRDHTIAQSYADLGIIAKEDIAGHHLRHVLTQAVGGPGESVEADLHGFQLSHGDRLLLCTDGLSNVVDEDEICEVLGADGSSQDACDALVDLALEYGAPDNVTAIVASYSIDREP